MLQDASKYMRHSKRHTLSTEDVNSALISNLKEVIGCPLCKADASKLLQDSCVLYLPFLEPTTLIVAIN